MALARAYRKAIWMDNEGPLTGELPRLEVLAPARSAPRAKPSKASSSSSHVPDLASGSAIQFSTVEDSSEGFWPALMALPSWLVSFIVHLTLMVVLATCTFVAHHEGPIFLELAQTAAENEPTMMEVLIEDPALEDPFDSLEPDDALSLDAELPPVDLEEEVLPEIYETVDAFDVSGLPEFSSQPIAGAKGDSEDDGSKKSDSKNGDEGTEFFGAKSYGSEFVFVIDCSDSMSVGYRWERAVNELVATLDQFDSEQKFLVLLYNDRNYMMFGAPDDQKLIPATDVNKRRISNWLDAAKPFSGTRPGKSIQLALKKKPDAIYFLSDGELRDKTMFGLRTWNVARKGPDGIKRLTPIHTVLLGSNFGRETMRIIAEENNGIFTHVR